jgi:hypothetical protein
VKADLETVLQQGLFFWVLVPLIAALGGHR